ncbi:hypothetical protein P9272_32740 [Mesorhizobium sp. WSM4976]|uniref:hypothetical protein n=1 Tax=Mesorhizobium sp. WSM4976 TaxID=3038549 RepID=UPI002416A75C|nr:hypothetical protein [Mesorhizobium sp. WSM4976]MDG4898303.1 hypothetical protein [Mesorhizobium sp. WSM4976]
MPNNTVPAAGEAMPAAKMNRRLILAGIASIPAIGGAVAAPTALDTVSPVDRFQAALAELKAAAVALDNNIYNWTVESNGGRHCGLLIRAWRKTTEYEGDGWYATVYDGDPDEERVFVQFDPEKTDGGERWFRLTSYYRGRKATAWTPESDFETNYGRKF